MTVSGNRLLANSMSEQPSPLRAKVRSFAVTSSSSSFRASQLSPLLTKLPMASRTEALDRASLASATFLAHCFFLSVTNRLARSTRLSPSLQAAVAAPLLEIHSAAAFSPSESSQLDIASCLAPWHVNEVTSSINSVDSLRFWINEYNEGWL